VRKKADKAFFEAFRRSDGSKKSRAWWMPKQSVGVAKGRDAQTTERNASRKYDMTSPPGRVALTFSREALIVMIVIGAALLIISHVWGYRRGLTQPGVGTRRLAQDIQSETLAGRDTAEVSQSDASGIGNDSMVLNIGTSRALEPPFHTVRIISGIPLDSARKIKADFLAQGYDAFIYDQPQHHGYTVNVGRYASRRDLQKSNLLLKIAQSAEYKKCYPIEIDDTERITL